jgi:putative transposase
MKDPAVRMNGMTSERRYREKRIRLDRHLYKVPDQITAITISSRYRTRFFEQHDFTTACCQALREVGDRQMVKILIFCFMPDHLHLLLQTYETGDVIEFVQRYKSWTTRIAWQHGISGKVWQPRFYDHILREGEDPIKQMRYIAENPIRAGLAETISQYPYVGSFTYDLNEFDW